VLPHGDLREETFRVGPTNHLSAPTSGNAWSRHFLAQVLPMPESIYHIAADTYLFELAPFFGPLRALADPLTLYRQHDKNHESNLAIEKKVQRELRLYEHYCGVAQCYLAGIGVQADLERWRRNSWWHRHEAVLEAIRSLPKPCKPIILVDDGTLEPGPIGDRRRLPFLER